MKESNESKIVKLIELRLAEARKDNNSERVKELEVVLLCVNRLIAGLEIGL